MDEKFIRDRITELRLQKDVPERKMSIELGHSTSYIHKYCLRPCFAFYAGISLYL